MKWLWRKSASTRLRGVTPRWREAVEARWREAVEETKTLNMTQRLKEQTVENGGASDDMEKEVKALNTYYEVASAEYDRIHSFYDQIDNKVNFLIAVVIGIPIAVIGFASQLAPKDVDKVALVLGLVGLISFLIAGWHVISAIRVRDVKLGIPYKEFEEYCRTYDDKTMKEWVAIALIKSSEYNYSQGMEKVGHLQSIMPWLIVEAVSFLAAIAYVLLSKL